MEEDFFEAAIRHWNDGTLLEEEEAYDNAVCMQRKCGSVFGGDVSIIY